MGKVISKIYYGIVVLVLLLLVVLIFPISGKPRFFVVQSGSMEPTIKTGAIVAVKPAETYQVGDIITFGPVSTLKVPTTHRIVEIKGTETAPTYVTKGDANNVSDLREVARRDVIGKVIFNIPYLGYVVATAQNKYGFLALIVIPALFIIVGEIQKIVSEVKAHRSKNQVEIKNTDEDSLI